MTIAVTGASGHLGRLVIAALKARQPASDILALVRDPAKAADLGVAARAFDYNKPETLAAALAGVDKLLLISSSEVGQRKAQHRAVIAAARQAGVKLLAYTSLLHADGSILSLAEEHGDTEAALKQSGLPFVLLRNGWYTENHTVSIPAALSHGVYVGSAGEGRISAAARADYAEAAAAVLTSEGHAGKTYELAGDTAFTLSELAAELSRQSGQTIAYKNLPQADFAALLEGAGFPPALAQAFASWDFDASKGALFDDSRQLSRLIGHQTQSLQEAVAAALA